MERHLPILQIIVPLIAAPLCLLLRQRTLVLGFAICVCWATFAMAVMLFLRIAPGTVPRETNGRPTAVP